MYFMDQCCCLKAEVIFCIRAMGKGYINQTTPLYQSEEPSPTQVVPNADEMFIRVLLCRFKGVVKPK